MSNLILMPAEAVERVAPYTVVPRGDQWQVVGPNGFEQGLADEESARGYAYIMNVSHATELAGGTHRSYRAPELMAARAQHGAGLFPARPALKHLADCRRQRIAVRVLDRPRLRSLRALDPSQGAGARREQLDDRVTAGV